MKYNQVEPLDIYDGKTVVAICSDGRFALYVDGEHQTVAQNAFERNGNKSTLPSVAKAAIEELGGEVIEDIDSHVFYARSREGDKVYQSTLKDMDVRRMALLKAHEMRQQAESLQRAADTLERG